ncbi:16S rRNA (cytosine967-C5)-methyltransferase [Salinicoccus kekensis]|uniref:16S rRNA (cytosine(967)-C(5))-methyltransferase n=2 Tax=Salinicoccus kekensis TaxID=714307 RepID=A0A285U817_9STAP|nr:16S rRNA (cytosine967-C5)-methyltransferase [Salinicoccus kekensis]
MMKMTVREAAFAAYMKIMDEKAYSNIVIDEVLKSGEISGKDAGLFTELIYGTLSRRLTLEFYLQPFLRTKVKKWHRHLLEMAAYQMIYLDRVPAYAVINETVEIAKEHGGRQAGNTTNAILRNLMREPLRDPSEIKDPQKKLSVETSIPKWMISHWVTHYKTEGAERIAQSLTENPEMYIRVNSRQTDPETLKERLALEGHPVETTALHPDALIVTSGASIMDTDAYKDGDFSIQDVSSMFVNTALDRHDGEVILDACSAPGGKGLHALEKNPSGHVDLSDIYDHKVRTIERNAKRLKLDNFDAFKGDATEHEYPGMYDKIIVDAPCSGLGVIKRKPEIRYERNSSDIDSLVDLQLGILDHVKQFLKPGGILIYATCTIHQMENENVAYTFIKSNDNFKFDDFHIPALDFTGPHRQILPYELNTDGFFIARFKKDV